MTSPETLLNKLLPIFSATKENFRVKQPSIHVEVELQFGYTKKENQQTLFTSGVSYDEFQNIIRMYPSTPIHYVDEIDTTSQIRKSTYENGEMIFVKKNRVLESNKVNKEGSLLATQYGTRLALSTEQTIPDPLNFQSTIIREKKRYTYKSNGYQIDATEVKSGSTTKYEVEVELYDLHPKRVTMVMEKIFKVLKASPELFTTSMVYDVYYSINRLLGIEGNRLKREILSEARDLTYQDLTYGELVGNPSVVYRVTHKTDGKRYMMAALPSGIWMLMPGTRTIHRLTTSSPQDAVNSVLDGELVPSYQMLVLNKEDNKKYDNYYFVFDCLVSKEEDLTRNYNQEHFFRMQVAEEINSIINDFLQDMYPPEHIYVQCLVKTFLQIFTVDTFYETMQLMFLQQKELPFENDGFIFTPANLPYYPGKLETPVGTLLTKSQIKVLRPNIKWKPLSLRTIDLAVIQNQLYSFHMEGSNVVYDLFRGTKKYPLPQIEFPSVPDKTVVEFNYNQNKLLPYRIRTDKPVPNKSDIVKSIWNNIFEGPLKETLLGEDLTLMRRYHNRIKKSLFENISTPKYLLDIGSGYGGDLSKWKTFNKVVAVEPDPEHITELQRRLSTSFPDMIDKVFVLQAGGEDTELITNAVQQFFGQKATTISLMLSLSFFGSHDKQVTLRDTIHQNLVEGGDILFLTIDGDLVRQTFEPAFQPDLKTNELVLNTAILKYNKGVLEIDIPGTIVEKQVEEPPVLGNLFSVLSDCLVVNLQRADQEKFLSKGETILSNMYSYGKLQLLGGPVSEIEVEIKEPLDVNMYMVSVITDKFQVIHAFLKLTDSKYQENNTLVYRKSVARELYEELDQIYDLEKSSLYEVLCQEFDVMIMVNNQIYGNGEKRLAMVDLDGLIYIVVL